MPTLLITGCNRGLGLEFVTQYGAADWKIYAVARRTSPELQAVIDKHKANIHFIECDLTQTLKPILSAVKDSPIDLLLCNAGVYPKLADLDDTRVCSDKDVETFLQGTKVNVLAPLRLASALRANVAASSQKKMAFITSKMGSIADNSSGGHHAYRATKAALNAVCVSLSVDYAKDNICVIIQHPGWVKTDMGGKNAPMEADAAIRGMMKVFAETTKSGCFLDPEGKEIPW